MGSLTSPCTVVLTNSRISSSLLIPNNARPARKSRRFEVSCNGGVEEGGGRIDRRNMLMGLGGLYSAANLLSPPSDPKSLAAPIPPPDFKTCGLSHVTNRAGTASKDVPCCPPPFSGEVKPYVLPEVLKMRVRKAAHRLDPKSIDQYEEAIRLMKNLPDDDPRSFTQQAKIHCAYCNGAYPQSSSSPSDPKISVHYSWLFFPFHRWYLFFYERILGNLVGDENFALPYWNWDNPRGGMIMPPIFDKESSSLYDTKRNQLHRGNAVVSLRPGPDSDTDDRQKRANNLSIMHNEMISGLDSALGFMGEKYIAGDPVPPTTKGGTSERGSHIGIHAWVGDPNQEYNEDMGNFYSAGNDPLFYCHHANVDRMWTLWRSLDTTVPKNINDPDYLNSSFVFFDENKEPVSVKVGDCLDYTALGYNYQYNDISPWVYYSPQRRSKKADMEKLKKRAEVAVAEEVKFPITLRETRRIQVKKSAKGKADEELVLVDVVTNPTKLIKFDIFINDEDEQFSKVDRAEYVGSFGQLLHTSAEHSDMKTDSSSSLRFPLKALYEYLDVDDDDTVVVTLYPIYNGKDVSIGGIKIIQATPKAA